MHNTDGKNAHEDGNMRLRTEEETMSERTLDVGLVAEEAACCERSAPGPLRRPGLEPATLSQRARQTHFGSTV